MEKISQFPPAVLDMLAQKKLSSLSAEDKALVLQFMDEETYSKLHQTYLNIQVAEANDTVKLKLRPQTQEKLIAAMRKRRKPGMLVYTMQYKVPAWQAAAAVIILFCSFLFLRSGAKDHTNTALAGISDTVKIVTTEVQKVFVHDTVYLEREKKKASAQPNRNIVLADNRNTLETGNLLPLHFERLSVLTLKNQEDIKPSGNSLSDDTLVNKFNFVTIN